MEMTAIKHHGYIWLVRNGDMDQLLYHGNQDASLEEETASEVAFLEVDAESRNNK